jgi:shikimate dehydrogenase
MADSSFFRLGLIGWPVEHSLSPVIHTAALHACGLKGKYELFPVLPLLDGKQDLEEIFQRMRNGEIQGINITIPHKQNVIPLLDSLTPVAHKIGAVNTVCLENGKLIGDNTDADGFLNDLKQNISQIPSEKTALVLGAGGSSRAVTYALSRDGWQVNVAARRLDQAQSLADDLSENQQFDLSAIHLDPKVLMKLQPGLIVNTTPVGMTPNTTESPWLKEISFPIGCFIYDLVYNPKETLFVRQAREAGLEASNGLGMLLEQAALAFERWTGNPAPRLAMEEAVMKHLKQSHSNKEVEGWR